MVCSDMILQPLFHGLSALFRHGEGLRPFLEYARKINPQVLFAIGHSEALPEQIRALVNYMFVLAEQLRYMLSNLKTENWNRASLQAFSQETTDAAAKSMEEQLQAVAEQAEKLEKQLSLLTAAHGQDMTRLEERDAYFERTAQEQAGQILQLQEDASALQAQQAQLSGRADTLDGQVADVQAGLDEETQARTALAEQTAALTAQLEILTQILTLQVQQEDEAEKKTVTLGGEGMEVRIVGKAIYCNEELIGGTEDETA